MKRRPRPSRAELKHLLITQKAAFNSPVWFNIGVEGVPQQGSACFILAVEDSMRSILNWYTEEGIIFKGGSGAGVNLSKIRSSAEALEGGGTASGPVSFMRGADASAGTIKSGGKTRRAAKMVILDVDHPDIEEFVWCKANEENKARVLRDAGFDMDLDGKDIHSIQYQNANNSVRVSDDFMQAVLDDADWNLVARHGGRVVRSVKARELWRQVARAAWECADPGLQFDSTINKWHTSSNTDRINGSNPCSEYMHIDNSACNLASLNLMKFLGSDGQFDVDAFKASIEVLFTAQEIIVGAADYPTEKIGENSRKLPPARTRLRQPRRPVDGVGPRVRLGRGTRLGRGHHCADDRSRLRDERPHGRAHGTPRGLRRERRADDQRAAHAPRRVVPDRRRQGARGDPRGGPAGVGGGGRPRHAPRCAQRPGVRAGPHRAPSDC